MADLSMEQVTRYLALVDRRMYIVMHSGVDWKPEYEQELEDIDREISVLRRFIDVAHESRQDPGQVQDDSHCCEDDGRQVSRMGGTVEKRLKDYMGYQVWKVIDNKGLPSEKVTYMLNDRDGNNVDCFSTLPALKKGARLYVS